MKSVNLVISMGVINPVSGKKCLNNYGGGPCTQNKNR